MKLTRLIKIFTLVAAIAAPSIKASVTTVVTPFMKGDGNSYGTDLYSAYIFKTKSDHTVASELRWRLTKTDGDDTANFNHGYLRFTITSPKTIDVGGDWKVGWSYRYFPPTISSEQLAGSYGRVGFRPWITKDYGILDLKFRNISYLWLQRNGYQENVSAKTPDATSVGNPLAATYFEILPQIDFAESASGGFYFLPYVVVGFKYVMAAPGADTTWENIVNIVPELGYSFKKFSNGAAIALYYDETGSFGTDEDFEMFKKEKFEVGLSWTQPL